MTYAEFVNKYNGQSIDYDGVYGAQCVDLAKFYLRDAYGLSPGSWGDAHAYWNSTNPAILAKFDKVPNGASNVPKQGDILVYSQNTPGSGGAGHIEIFDRKTGAGKYVSFSQNWGGAYAHMVEHTDNYKYVLGWLTPKQSTNTGGDMPIPDHDNYFGRYNKLMMQVRGREMSRDEFRKNIVGVSDLTAVERISDNPESDRATDYQQWALANRASIEKQINDLTARVNQLSGEVKGLAQTVNEKQAEISSLQDKAADLEKENKELKAQLATCGNSEDTELLNSFGQLLRKLIERLGLK